MANQQLKINHFLLKQINFWKHIISYVASQQLKINHFFAGGASLKTTVPSIPCNQGSHFLLIRPINLGIPANKCGCFYVWWSAFVLSLNASVSTAMSLASSITHTVVKLATLFDLHSGHRLTFSCNLLEGGVFHRLPRCHLGRGSQETSFWGSNEIGRKHVWVD